jgi:hypothetical protein
MLMHVSSWDTCGVSNDGDDDKLWRLSLYASCLEFIRFQFCVLSPVVWPLMIFAANGPPASNVLF